MGDKLLRLVVDTNQLMAALIRDSTTRKIIVMGAFELYAPEGLQQEIEKHIPTIGDKNGLSPVENKKMLHTLLDFIQIVPHKEYLWCYQTATNLLEAYDLDDVPFLALALALPRGDGLWSHDSHVQHQDKVRVWSTAELLDRLATSKGPTHTGPFR